MWETQACIGTSIAAAAASLCDSYDSIRPSGPVSLTYLSRSEKGSHGTQSLKQFVRCF